MAQVQIQLPQNYNIIEENDNYFILIKRPDIPYKVMMQYDNGIIIEWGGMDGKWFIRKIYYPKSKFTREKIEAVAYRTRDCPYCIMGVKSASTPDIFIKSKQLDINRNNQNDKGDNMALEDIGKKIFPEEINAGTYLLGGLMGIGLNSLCNLIPVKKARWPKWIVAGLGFGLPLLKKHLPVEVTIKGTKELFDGFGLSSMFLLQGIIQDWQDMSQAQLANPIEEQLKDMVDFFKETFTTQDIQSALKKRGITPIQFRHGLLLPKVKAEVELAGKGPFGESKQEENVEVGKKRPIGIKINKE